MAGTAAAMAPEPPQTRGGASSAKDPAAALFNSRQRFGILAQLTAEALQDVRVPPSPLPSLPRARAHVRAARTPPAALWAATSEPPAAGVHACAVAAAA